MTAALIISAIILLIPAVSLQAQTVSFRTNVEGTLEVSPESAENSLSIGINSSALIKLGDNARFLRGIELEITAPQSWLQYRGALVMTMYNNLNTQYITDMSELTGNRIANEVLPTRLRIIYHIPIRAQHGLRNSTSISVPTGVVQQFSFPLMFRLMQLSKGLPDEFENMRFRLAARPILNDEGAVRIIPRFPPQVPNRPFIVLINDNVISNISEEIMLKEGENHLVVLSDDYRNMSSRFIVERARVTDLIINLQDPTPVLVFEAPQNAQVFLNNSLVLNRDSVSVDPGSHEVRFIVGDYTIIRTLNVQRGKTYRVALLVDLTIQEED